MRRGEIITLRKINSISRSTLFSLRLEREEEEEKEGGEEKSSK